MPIKQTLTDSRVPVYVFTEDLDTSARAQLCNIANLPVVHHHVAAMPDVHKGIGATIGSVIATRRAVIPAAVGVDIGCGMNAVRLSLTADQLPENLKRIRAAIENSIPVGFAEHQSPAVKPSDASTLRSRLEAIADKHSDLRKMQKRFDTTWARQLGTLGGGNHFIELCVDESGAVWVMLHSGSRGIGNAIGRYFIALAKKDMGKHLSNLPDKDLAYFSEGAEHFNDYVEAVLWAQEYAQRNRAEMMRLIVDALKNALPPFSATQTAINCHHNYVAEETHFEARLFVTRKGAIRAGKKELGIIPGSMGTCSYIVRGKGSAASFESCAHGAGRRMSRSQARRTFDVDALRRQTRGVECRIHKSVLDESPAAYKDIDTVMSNQADLVDIVHRLKQVVCVKG
ncbi:MAG: RNA-splicing ligase RtcB [Gammaproteobacteria bacterium]|nr:RNA-splicing ligase RtcB [Gammaproteobacteria bacterium]